MSVIGAWFPLVVSHLFDFLILGFFVTCAFESRVSPFPESSFGRLALAESSLPNSSSWVSVCLLVGSRDGGTDTHALQVGPTVMFWGKITALFKMGIGGVWCAPD